MQHTAVRVSKWKQFEVWRVRLRVSLVHQKRRPSITKAINNEGLRIGVFPEHSCPAPPERSTDYIYHCSGEQSILSGGGCNEVATVLFKSGTPLALFSLSCLRCLAFVLGRSVSRPSCFTVASAMIFVSRFSLSTLIYFVFSLFNLDNDDSFLESRLSR